MELFLTVFILMYLLSLLKFSYVDSKQRLYQTIVCAILLIMLQALRAPTVGQDILGINEFAYGYFRIFYVAHDESFLSLLHSEYHMDVGWLFFCKLVSLIFNNFQFFLLVESAIQISLVAFVINRLSKDIPTSFLIYACLGLYMFSFSGLRQAFAFSITFVAAYHLYSGNNKFFILLTLLATTIHSSAIIFLLAYTSSKVSLNRRKGLIWLVAYLISIPFMTSIIAFFSGFLFGEKYLNYLDEGGAISMFILYTLIYVGLLVFVKSDDKLTFFVRMMVFAAVIGQSFGIVSTSNMTRIGYYFTIFLPIAIPIIAHNRKETKIATFVIACLTLLFFYLKGNDESLHVFPYEFFWNGIY